MPYGHFPFKTIEPSLILAEPTQSFVKLSYIEPNQEESFTGHLIENKQ